MDKAKLIHQLFIGKVADVIGIEKTTALLKKAKEEFDTPVVRKRDQLNKKWGDMGQVGDKLDKW